MSMVRLSEEQRRAVIVTAAVTLSATTKLVDISYESVAEKCSVKTSVGTVRGYFRTKAHLWRAIAKHSSASAYTVQQAREMAIIK